MFLLTHRPNSFKNFYPPDALENFHNLRDKYQQNLLLRAKQDLFSALSLKTEQSISAKMNKAVWASKKET